MFRISTYGKTIAAAFAALLTALAVVVPASPAAAHDIPASRSGTDPAGDQWKCSMECGPSDSDFAPDLRAWKVTYDLQGELEVVIDSTDATDDHIPPFEAVDINVYSDHSRHVPQDYDSTSTGHSPTALTSFTIRPHTQMSTSGFRYGEAHADCGATVDVVETGPGSFRTTLRAPASCVYNAPTVDVKIRMLRTSLVDAIGTDQQRTGGRTSGIIGRNGTVSSRLSAADPVDRSLAAAERYLTANRGMPDGPADPVVVIARSDVFADALSAGTFNDVGPVLLTPSDRLDGRYDELLGRLKEHTSDAVIVGGEAAISPAVADQLRSRGYRVTRVAGADRVATSTAVADYAWRRTTRYMEENGFGARPPAGLLVMRAYGPGTAGFADTLAASAKAGYDRPVLLVGDRLSAAQHKLLRSWAADGWTLNATIIGGPAAVSEAVARELSAYNYDPAYVARVAGSDRAATAAAVASTRSTAPFRVVLVDGWAATSWQWGFTLAGWLSTNDGMSVLLTSGTTLPPATRDWLAANGGHHLEIVCATGVTDEACQAAVAATR